MTATAQVSIGQGRYCEDCKTPVPGRFMRYCDRCRIAHRGPTATYVHTDRSDDIVRQAYRRFWEFKSRKALHAAAAKLGWPHHVVKKRGAALGLTRTSDNKPWSESEERILTANAHHGDEYIRKRLAEAGFHRTIAGIHLKCKRDRIKSNLDGFSGLQLAEAMGIDSHKVTAWIVKGFLKAERREMDRKPQQGGNPWWIHRREVRDFLFKYPDEVDLKKVEKWWFLDLITDGRICR